MSGAILKYDAACQAIAEAKSFDDVQEWMDKAAAVREYGRRIHNRQMEIDAIEIRVRAKKRRGELLLQLKVAGQLREGKKKLSSADDSLPRITLEELGVTANESSEEQKIAGLEGNSFERLVARCRAHAEANPKQHSFDVLKPPPEGPINGARSVMGSRHEPDDSLDYFPTPPWATRALIEVVFPALGVRKLGSAWEPACGEGHIAEVLREYFPEVIATDIHNYGYGAGDSDFLDPATDVEADWIITNPPFGKKAEDFTHKALELANGGVAMFLRLQWLETNGRYERLFAPHPPTIIAQFAERVPLCKGRWNPEGDTATAYLWIVWMPHRVPKGPTRFFWIPPGQRDALTREDDEARFTAQPVIRKDHPIDANGSPLKFDHTGEIIDAEIPATNADGASSDDPGVVGEVVSGGQIQAEANPIAAAIAASPGSGPAIMMGVVAAVRLAAELDPLLDIPEFLRRPRPPQPNAEAKP
jgi:hypothetical protein